jgi:hypothetical protein
MRKPGRAWRVAEKAYTYQCCAVCGSQPCLTLAHLNHNAADDDPDNLAFMCWTHHRYYDAGLYPIEAIRSLRDHWQQTQGKECYKAMMKDAGQKALATRRRNRNTKQPLLPHLSLL